VIDEDADQLERLKDLKPDPLGWPPSAFGSRPSCYSAFIRVAELFVWISPESRHGSELKAATLEEFVDILLLEIPVNHGLPHVPGVARRTRNSDHAQ
jgi:hypothetical protein